MSPIPVSDGGGKDFTPHPEGQFPVRCIDVVDLGWQSTEFGPKYKIRVVFYAGKDVQREHEGKTETVPLLIMEKFTASLNEKANLRKFLESWRGKSFTPTESKLFDMERMLNAGAFVQVKHNVAKNGKTYANISSIMRLPEGMSAPAAPVDWVRACDKPDWKGPAPHPDMSDPVPEPEPTYTGPDADDDLPFDHVA